MSQKSGKKKPSHKFGSGNTLGATGRRRAELRRLLPGLRELAADRVGVPYRWRRRLQRAAKRLESASAAKLASTMVDVAALLRDMADDLDDGEGES